MTLTNQEQREVVVVGSGLAGLTAALRAEALGHSVTLVTKGALDESNSRWAQGGIAAAVFDDDSVALHVTDTLAAGAGLSIRRAVEVLCADGAIRIDDLVRWGVDFDRDGTDWSRGLEAAHSRPRVLHAGGDATGKAIVLALIERLGHTTVRVIENAFVLDLVVARVHPAGARSAAGTRVVGVDLLVAGSELRIRGDAVVLATGGAGQLYEFTTNPAGATGDGLAAAWRAGARVDDLEFYQFHPTALAVPGSFLISEAVRGEGAVLLDAGGRRFMAGVDPRAELAPRDIVARGIAAQMAEQAGLPVHLDATALGRATLERRFPTITAATRAAGLDWSVDPIPVTPAAHYFMGGVTTDIDGRTSIPGLYAVGEVALTGVHGANRLASNSLLEAAVFGWRAIEAIGGDDLGDASTLEGARPEPVARDGATGASRGILRSDLQRVMWEHVGVTRSEQGLRAAEEWLAEATVEVPRDRIGGGDSVDRTDRTDRTDRFDLETANLLHVARLVVAGALAREESRGAHFRIDFPYPSTEFAHPLSWAREVPQHAHR